MMKPTEQRSLGRSLSLMTQRTILLELCIGWQILYIINMYLDNDPMGKVKAYRMNFRAWENAPRSYLQPA